MQSLDRAFEGEKRLIIVDEVGPLELKGEGWTNVLDRRLTEPGHDIRSS